MGEASTSVASDGLSVDRPSLTGASDQSTLVADRLHEILVSGGGFDAIYRHILAAPGKRVRAAMVLACARLLPSAAAVPLRDAVDVACAIEMLHEASLVHDDICDGSLLRRDVPSVPAAFGVRTAARAGFHLAGKALQVLARVLADNPAVFARLGEAPGVTYLDRISELSFGQLVESLPPAVDDAALRRHYRLVAGAKTGTLFRLACSYGGTAGAVDHDRNDLRDGELALYDAGDYEELTRAVMLRLLAPALGGFALLTRLGPCTPSRGARVAMDPVATPASANGLGDASSSRWIAPSAERRTRSSILAQ